MTQRSHVSVPRRDDEIPNWRIRFPDRTVPLPLLRPALLGRSPRCDLQLGHGSILPLHARIERRGSRLRIERASEEARLLVDDREVESAELRGGERVRVGDLEFVIERGIWAPSVLPTPRPPPSFEEEVARALSRELKRAPWFLISAAVHLVLLMWARELVRPRPPGVAGVVVRTDVVSLADAMPRDEETAPDLHPPRLDEPDPQLPDLEPLADEPVLDLHYLEDRPISAVRLGDIAKIGIGAGATRGIAGFGSRGMSLSGVGGALRGTLESYRSRGLDVAILVDTTASMESFLRAAKDAIDRILTDLADLVPTVRLGIVAYRDRGDAYVTRVFPLSTDRYAIRNFLESLDAAGGGDVPEALLEAFEVALEQLQWRQRAHRVMLVVADAPPHAEDLPKLRMLLRGLSHSTLRRTMVSTIFTGSGMLSPSRQQEAERALEEIARLGGGEFTRLENSRGITQKIVTVTFGSHFRGELQKLLLQRRTSPRTRLVSEHVRRRDVRWLVPKLHLLPIEPDVVDGLIAIGSPAVALRCVELVGDASLPRPTREAALYIVRRITGFDRDLDLSGGRPLAADELESLHRALERAYQPGRRRPRGS